MYIRTLVMCSIIFLQCQSMDNGWDDGVDWKGIIETGRKLKKDDNIYKNPPKSISAPLTKELVTDTPYWKKMETANDTDKDAAFNQLNGFVFEPDAWNLQRYHIAAAAMINARLGLTEALGKAVYHNDQTLCELLLEKGGDPNGFRDIFPFLYSVKTAALAQIFLKYNASVTCMVKYSKDTLLHTVADHYEYEPELIRVYRKAGLSPLTVNEYGSSPLHNLLFGINDMMLNSKTDTVIKKADYLLEGLSPKEVLALLYQCGGDGLVTVLEKLEKVCAQEENNSKRREDFLKTISLMKKDAYKELHAHLLEQKKIAETKIGKFTLGSFEDRVSRPPRRYFEFHIHDESEK